MLPHFTIFHCGCQSISKQPLRSSATTISTFSDVQWSASSFTQPFLILTFGRFCRFLCSLLQRSMRFPTFRHRFHHVLLLTPTFLDIRLPAIASTHSIDNIEARCFFKKFSDSSEWSPRSGVTGMNAGHVTFGVPWRQLKSQNKSNKTYVNDRKNLRGRRRIWALCEHHRSKIRINSLNISESKWAKFGRDGIDLAVSVTLIIKTEWTITKM
jgi:hypothetical protein